MLLPRANHSCRLAGSKGTATSFRKFDKASVIYDEMQEG
jgi:hypothetical protein